MKITGITFIFMLSLITQNYFSQSEKGCGFNFAQDYARDHFADYDVNLAKIEALSGKTQKMNSSTVYTVPVVFHILHQGGNENISDAQIQRAVQVMTRDFRKLNADTSAVVQEFKALAADCQIEFVLASIDPDGHCTNGITRHYDPNTNWTVDQLNYKYTWPPTKYLNVYVVKSMQAGAAGYTYLPGTVPAAMDAIVVLHNYVGDIGTSTVYRSRTLSHESGHWFGLSHTWGNSNNPGVACGDDGVSDTPITKGHTFCNLSNAIDCTSGIKENIQNYMEYAYCSNMFTIGQADKMAFTITNGIAGRNNVVSASNLLATGVTNPNYNCPPKAEFGFNSGSVCMNQPYTFIDQSYNGQVDSWLWSSPAASGVSTIQNGVLTFTESGLQDVKLKAGNSFGYDSLTKVQTIAVLSSDIQALNTSQDFETFSYPDTKWITTNPQYGSGFHLNPAVGNSGTHCLYINNYSDNPNEKVILYTPAYDLNAINFANLVFSYAYTQQSGNNDQLRIFISTDCGVTWQLAYNQSGSGLNTRNPINGVEYASPTASEWKKEYVNLGSFLTNSLAYFKFEFTPDINGPGNNFFLDDIFVDTSVGFEELNKSGNLLKVYPVPAKEKLVLDGVPEHSEIEVINMLGVRMNVAMTAASSTKRMINTETLKSGVYIISVKDESGKCQFTRFTISE